MAGEIAVNVLLDTCAILALSRGGLSAPAGRALRHAPRAMVSSVSAWEVAIKVAAGRLKLVAMASPLEWFENLAERHDLQVCQLDAATACAAAALPVIHHDPFDRVLVAIATRENLTLLTSDQTIPRYPGIQVIW